MAGRPTRRRTVPPRSPCPPLPPTCPPLSTGALDRSGPSDEHGTDSAGLVLGAQLGSPRPLPHPDFSTVDSVVHVPTEAVPSAGATAARRRSVRLGKRPQVATEGASSLSISRRPFPSVAGPSVGVSTVTPAAPVSAPHVDPLLVLPAPGCSPVPSNSRPYLTSLVCGLPVVPPARAAINQRKSRLVRQHRTSVRRGIFLFSYFLDAIVDLIMCDYLLYLCLVPYNKSQPVYVRLPLTEEFVSTLKAALPGRSYYGPPHHTCVHCGASFWFQERCKRLSTARRVVCSRCCRAGKVSLPVPRPWPSPLRELMRFNGGPPSKDFMRSIRQYNSMFAFTSLGVHVDRSVNVGNGPYIFKICGMVHHKIGSLIPDDGHRPEYAQLYIHDTVNELDHRMALFHRDEEEEEDDLQPHAQLSDQRSGLHAHQPRRRPVRPRRPTGEPDREVVRSLMEMFNSYENPLVNQICLDMVVSRHM